MKSALTSYYQIYFFSLFFGYLFHLNSIYWRIVDHNSTDNVNLDKVVTFVKENEKLIFGFYD